MSNREIANINSFLNFLAIYNLVEANYISEDINMDEPRDRSIIPSRVMSRVTLAHSTILFISYIKRIKVQSSNLSWFNQTKQKNFKLSYASPKRGNLPNQDKAYGSFHLPSTHIEDEMFMKNTSDQQYGLGTSSIPYSNSDPADSNLWDSNLKPYIYIWYD